MVVKPKATDNIPVSIIYKTKQIIRIYMKKYAVIGNPIAQSKSPLIHHDFGKQLGIELDYAKLCPKLDEFEIALKEFFEDQGLGLNVTMPFKEQAYQQCEVLTQRAKLAQAVNTLYMENGKLCGDTTDGTGLVRDLTYQGVELANKRVLLIGAGGAAKGSVAALLAETPLSLMITNRTVVKAQTIKDVFNSNLISVCTLSEVESDYDIIINSTSCSITNDILDMNPKVFEGATFAYDMSYKNKQTSFNKWAEDNNKDIKTSDGLGMLIEQAAESFRIWHQQTPDTTNIRAILREIMA